MKRKIASIILVFSFIFAAFEMPQAIAAGNTDTIVAREDLLMQLITLPSGVSAGSASITRGLYAQTLAQLLGGKFERSNTLLKSSFYDVTGYDAVTQAIIFLENKNVISGDINKYFNPNENIKSEDAIKMLVTAMGYKPLAESAGGYPDGYINTASNIGLLKNTSASKGNDLTGEQLVNMFYNALDAYIVSVDSISGDKIEFSSQNETLLTGVLNLGHKKGMIRQTPYTSLYDAAGCTKGTVTVENENYYYDDSSIIDYLGYTVDIYYTDDKNEKTIVAYQISAKNEILTIDADQIDGFSDFTLSYRTGTSDKTVNKKLDKTISVIYNGKFVSSFTEEMVNIDMGTVTLISDGKSNYNVMIIEDYIDYVVATVDQENKIIYSRSDYNDSGSEVKNSFDLSENDVDYKICDARGLDIDLSEIAGNSIMSVASSLDGLYVKIIVSSDSVSGTINRITTDDNDNPVWIINENEYPVSRSFYQTEPVINTGVKAFVNYKGKIAYYIIQSSNDGWSTGYIIKLYEDDVDGYAVKILKSDNIISDYNFSEKININGESFSKAKEAFESCTYLFPEGRAKRQIIRFRTNGDDEITRVQTAMEEGSKKSPLRTTTKASRLYRSGAQSFGFETFINANTYLFVVPEETTPYVSGANTNFKIVDSSYFVDQNNVTVQAYTVGDNMTEAFALVATKDVNTTPSTIGDYINPSVVTKITHEINEYDEEVTCMTVQTGSTVNSYNVTPAALEQVRFGSEIKDFEIEPGDAIRYLRNSEGEINLIELDYDASTQTYKKPNSSTINNSYTCIYSFVYGRAEYRGSDNPSRIFVNINFESNPAVSRSGNRIIPIEKFGATIVDMSKKKPEVISGNAAELVKTADVFGQEKASRIIYNTNVGTPTRIIIYNY